MPKPIWQRVSNLVVCVVKSVGVLLLIGRKRCCFPKENLCLAVLKFTLPETRVVV